MLSYESGRVPPYLVRQQSQSLINFFVVVNEHQHDRPFVEDVEGSEGSEGSEGIKRAGTCRDWC
jgi:hypothetical protein